MSATTLPDFRCEPQQFETRQNETESASDDAASAREH
jgi:hypothetical protein